MSKKDALSALAGALLLAAAQTLIEAIDNAHDYEEEGE